MLFTSRIRNFSIKSIYFLITIFTFSSVLNGASYNEDDVFPRFWELVKNQRKSLHVITNDEEILKLANLLFSGLKNYGMELRGFKGDSGELFEVFNDLYNFLGRIKAPLTYSDVLPVRSKLKDIKTQSNLLRNKSELGIIYVDVLDMVDEFCEELNRALDTNDLDLGGMKEKFKYVFYYLPKEHAKPIFIFSTTVGALGASVAIGLKKIPKKNDDQSEELQSSDKIQLDESLVREVNEFETNLNLDGDDIIVDELQNSDDIQIDDFSLSEADDESEIMVVTVESEKTYSIEDLNISTRIKKALINAGIETPEKLRSWFYSDEQEKISRIGKSSLVEIKEALEN